MSKKTPLIFIGHGSPMNAVQDNAFTRSLRELGRKLERPRAAVVISAHWQSKGTQLTAGAHPEQIYDFFGFPDELYSLIYTPPGSPVIADEILSLCSDINISPNTLRGIDHGAWAVMKHVFPSADIPLLQISLDLQIGEREHYEIGKKLKALRDNNLLVIGSGNIVHNLYEMNYDQYGKAYGYALEFDAEIKDDLLKRDDDAIIDYKKHGDSAVKSVPTNEHYLPLLYVEAMKEDGESIDFFYEGIEHGSISMRSFIVG